MLDDIGSGFAKAQGALAEAGKQTSWINEQVSSGQLRMNPEAAEAAAKHCEDSAQDVSLMVSKATQIARVGGLGDYESSVQLQHHFEQKAQQSDAGAFALLQQLQDEMQKQADAFRAAAKDYRATDEQVADDLGKGQE